MKNELMNVGLNVLNDNYIGRLEQIKTVKDGEKELKAVKDKMNEMKEKGVNPRDENEINTIPTYEIAEMIPKQHWEVLRMIEGYEPPEGSKSRRVVGIAEVLNDHNVVVVDYFIKSSYVDAKGEIRKCYLCTKKGCDMLAHKISGEKGILFTARYIDRFYEMERMLKENSRESYTIENKRERAFAWLREQEENEYKQLELYAVALEERIEKLKLEPSAGKFKAFMDEDGTFGFRDLVKHLNGLGLNVKENEVRSFLREEGIICKQGRKYVISQNGVRLGYGLMRDKIVDQVNRPETRYTDKLRDMLLKVYEDRQLKED